MAHANVRRTSRLYQFTFLGAVCNHFRSILFYLFYYHFYSSFVVSFLPSSPFSLFSSLVQHPLFSILLPSCFFLFPTSLLLFHYFLVEFFYFPLCPAASPYNNLHRFIFLGL
uniref:Uncharacterized protein n=1 Tax=Cacopsylla melanoneura TaxID=428564 RepID=A0A8D8ZF05_9HEMI